MAAALFRRGAGFSVRCIHRELCRVIWRPQAALFSSKPSDRKQPRRTHIKKAKPQPAIDVAKLLEQLFSQRRPDIAPPAGKAPAKASSLPTKPPTTSSVKVSTSGVPPSLKTDPAVSVSPAASSFKQVDSVPEKTAATSNTAPLSPQPETASPAPLSFIQGFAADTVSSLTVPPTSTTPASLGSVAAAGERHTLAETIETSIETEPAELKTATVQPFSAHTVEENLETSSFSAATTEPVIESPVEPGLSPVETLQVRAAVVDVPVEPTADVPAKEVQTKGTDSGVVVVSHTAEEEPFIETTIDSPVDTSHFPLETLESRAAVAEGPVESTVDAAVDALTQAVEAKSTNSGNINLSHNAEEESLIETTIDASVEASTSPLDTLENRAAEGLVETIVEREADRADQSVQASSTVSRVNISCSPKGEALIENSKTIEAAVESRAAVSEGIVEPPVESLSHTALIQNTPESASLPLENEIESTVESSGNVAVEEGVNKSEQMTLESVTLHSVEVLVESLKADELLQTKSALDEKAEKQLQELLVQTGTEAEHKAAAETQNPSEGESEILSKALSEWDCLSEDLQELEVESGTLVKELLCHVPAALSKTPCKTSSASDPPAGANGESVHMEEKETGAEAMTLESITLAKVKAEVRGLETEVLLDTRNALEKEAEALAKEEKMEVKATIEDVSVFEDTTETDILALESISEATDAIEAETSIMLEAMFGSEQGPRQPPYTSLADQKLGQQDEAEKEPREQGGSILEAMTLESVTLAEVEASLGTLENEFLSETTDYLEKEAEILAGEKRVEVEERVVSEETTEALRSESLSLPENDALSEALQTEALMEELLFSVPGRVTGVAEDQVDVEAVRANIMDATVETGSVEADVCPASPALEEVLLGQEVEEDEAQTEVLGNEDGEGTHRDLDPVQRLFLDKIKEYNNMRRLNEGLLEAEPDYKKRLSEETVKLQRLYGGGDLSSFPEFTFSEPKMDQDSK